MVITIQGKEYELHFGIKFIRGMDEKYFYEDSGIKYGAGLELVYAKLVNHSPVALADVLWMATNTLTNRPTPAAVDRFLEEECEDIDALCDEVVNELKNGKITRGPVAKVEANLNAGQI